MFTAELVGDKALVQRVEEMPVSVRTALTAKAHQLAINLQGHIIRDKLSGQVLKQRSGALARSIQQEVTTEDLSVYGRVFSAGDVKYAAFWENGFHGTETVKQHFRTVLFGKTVDAFSVGPFQRKVDQNARSFMRTGLADMAAEITMGLKQAVVEGLSKR